MDQKLDLESVDFTINYTASLDFGAGPFAANVAPLRVKVTTPDGSVAFIDTLGSFLGETSLDQQSFTFGIHNLRGAETQGTWKVQFEQPSYTNVTIDTVKFDLYGGVADANDVFTYTDEFFTMAAVAGQSKRTVLSDKDGGIDWVNAAAISSDVVISLATGGGASFGGQKAFSIQRGTAIENAVSGDGNDRLSGNAMGNMLVGMRGNDKLYGLAGNDVLDGGTGTDWLEGGVGNDTLSGGLGDDSFFFDNKGTSGKDRITDFGTGDRLLLTAALNDGTGDGIITFGSNNVLNLDRRSSGDTLVLDGVDPAKGLKFAGMDDGLYVYVLNEPAAPLLG